MVRFLPFPRSDGIPARDSRETRGMRRSRFYICFSFFPQRLGKSRSRDLEREISLFARRRNLASRFCAASVRTTLARFSKRFAFRGYSFARTRRVARERSGGSCAFTRQKGASGGHAERGFSFFLFESLFTSLTLHENFSFLSLKKHHKQPSQKTFKIKKILGKKQKQNRPIPQWIRMKTGNTIRYNAKRRHWRRTKLNI